ncbi:protein phosphatase 2C domain-containing protein [Clostridium sp. CX1]|uniref:PP2C family serine/threonine-protein phosphatase n=1 Tax=Clostridium tanneri TaxID=3037988 RepID=A0ABU4JT77_9CLOT|nr:MULTISPECIES: PP2C family serine/threonine-protein phosphatase [unclassified Clostridium]MCT8975436.1 protein phosphatase 2C domain-containing protein [Clostridium sp. CX1]MDW8801333.1 PP2C family serine/threonine-protein phosphatase [Clostridium sp. A1-XYC3]
MEKLEIGRWKVAGASVEGLSHEKDSTPCQDKVAMAVDNRTAVIALADGAGSCKLSHYGAEIVVNKVKTMFIDSFDRVYNMDAKSAARYIISNIVSELREKLKEFEGAVLKDFSSTMLFVAVKDDRFIAGHVGDGVIGYISKDQAKVLSEPENGEFSNSTFFVTMDNSERYLRLSRGTIGNASGFLLMSDGTGSSFYDKKTRTLAPASNAVLGWLDENSALDVNKAIEKNLRELIRMKTNDDCSMAIMVLCKKNLDEFRDRDIEFKKDFLELSDDRAVENCIKVYEAVKKNRIIKKTTLRRVAKSIRLSKKIVFRHVKRMVNIGIL